MRNLPQKGKTTVWSPFLNACALSSVVFLFLPSYVYFFNKDSIVTLHGNVSLIWFVLAFLVSWLTLFPLFYLFERFTHHRFGVWLVIWAFLLVIYPHSFFESYFPQNTPILLSYILIGGLALLVLWIVGGKTQQTLLATIIVANLVYWYVLIFDQTHHEPEINQDTLHAHALSQSHNVFVFLFDGFTGEWLEKYVDEHPQLKQSLEGFVLFKEAISPAPSTPYAIPMIFKGNFEAGFAGKSLLRNIRLSFSGSIFDSFIQKGFSVVYYPIFAHPKKKEGVIEVLSNQNTGGKGTIRATIDFFSVVSDRILPKDSLAAILNTLPVDSYKLDEVAPLDWNHIPVPERIGDKSMFRHSIRTVRNMEALINGMLIGEHTPKAFLVHLLLPHSPAMYDRNGYVGKRTSYDQNSEYAVQLMKNFIEKLKDLSLYENSVIFFISDHGWGDPWGRYKLTKGSRFNSLLLLKAKHATGNLVFSNKVVTVPKFRSVIEKISMQNVHPTHIGVSYPLKVKIVQFLDRPWAAYKEKNYVIKELLFEGDFSKLPPWQISSE